jgi:hypothetical protein
MKNISRTAKFLPTWFQSKILPGSLFDLNACVGFRTSSPLQGVKYQLFNLIHKSELRTYTKVVLFKEKSSFCFVVF